MRKWGDMFKSVLLFFVSWVIVISLFHDLSAQHYARIDDRLGIELTLDMIRKGVQEQDTRKIFITFSPVANLKREAQTTRAQLAARLQTVFDNSARRQLQLERPFYPEEYERLRSSNFWDFDIVEPKITINGDSAFVDCELVLWGAAPEPNSQRHGRRVRERFIFFSPPKKPLTNLPEDTRPFPEQSGRKIGSQRAWQLVGFEHLLELLERQVGPNEKKSSGGSLEGRE